MIKKLKMKWYAHVIRKYREIGRHNWSAYNTRHRGGQASIWYGPDSWLDAEQSKKYRNAQIAYWKLRSMPYGADMTGQHVDVKRDLRVTKALDDLNAEYKEIVPTYFDESGQPKGSGPFVSND
jgi:hypothetical protein